MGGPRGYGRSEKLISSLIESSPFLCFCAQEPRATKYLGARCEGARLNPRPGSQGLVRPTKAKPRVLVPLSVLLGSKRVTKDDSPQRIFCVLRYGRGSARKWLDLRGPHDARRSMLNRLRRRDLLGSLDVVDVRRHSRRRAEDIGDLLEFL